MPLKICLLGRDASKYAHYAEVITQACQQLNAQQTELAGWQVAEIGADADAIFCEQIETATGLRLLRQYAAYLASHHSAPVSISDTVGQMTNNYGTERDFSQLLHYSDLTVPACFLPIEFAQPMRLSNQHRQYYIASGPRLLAELNQINLTLHVPGDYGENDPRKYQQLVSGSEWSPAKYLWGLLRWLCYESLAANLILLLESED